MSVEPAAPTRHRGDVLPRGRAAGDGGQRRLRCGRCARCCRSRARDGTQAEVKPATSVARNCTSVSPCAVIVAGGARLRAAPGRAAVGRGAVLVAGDAAAREVGRAGGGDRLRGDGQPRQRAAADRSARSGRCGRCGRSRRRCRGAGPTAEVLPAASVARNWMIVSPSADGRRGRAGAGRAPGGAAVGGQPELVGGDAGERVDGGVAVEDDAGDVLPGERAAGGGGRRRRRAVDAHRAGRRPGTDGAQAELLPARSTVRNCDGALPSAVIRPVVPVDGAPQVVPPSVEVRYS